VIRFVVVLAEQIAKYKDVFVEACRQVGLITINFTSKAADKIRRLKIFCKMFRIFRSDYEGICLGDHMFS